LDSHAATTLTSWHLFVTFCSLHVALKLRFFEHKPFEKKIVMGFGILNGISIGLLNLSLGFNSVGFYQVILFLSLYIFLSCYFHFCSLSNFSSFFWHKLYCICFQMTKLAIIPCTILLEILFLGKKFRSCLVFYY